MSYIADRTRILTSYIADGTRIPPASDTFEAVESLLVFLFFFFFFFFFFSPVSCQKFNLYNWWNWGNNRPLYLFALLCMHYNKSHFDITVTLVIFAPHYQTKYKIIITLTCKQCRCAYLGHVFLQVCCSNLFVRHTFSNLWSSRYRCLIKCK